MIWQGALSRREQAVEGSFGGVTWAGHSHQVLSPGRLWCPSQPIQPPLTPFARRSAPSSTSWVAAQRLWRKARMAGGTTGHSNTSKQTIRFKMFYWTSRETSGQKKHCAGLASCPLSGSLRAPTDLKQFWNIVKLELTVTWLEQIAEVIEWKKEKHRSLVSDCNKAGRQGTYLWRWAKEDLQEILCKVYTLLGIRDERKKGAINERTEAAQKDSKWV